MLMVFCLALGACSARSTLGGATDTSAPPGRAPTLSPTPSAAAASPAPTAPASPSRCHTGQLSLTLDAPTVTPTTQYQSRLVLTNISAGPCTLAGFPGVELTGDVSNGSKTYNPIRQSESPTKVVVDPGLNAVATLTALPGPDVCDNGTPWVPFLIDVTPPDETTHLEAPWPELSVDNCQGGATHPGTYLGAFHPGNLAPPTPAGLSGAGPFAGSWSHHGIGLRIDSTGSGTADWRTYATCGQDPPPCDTFSGNLITDGGHATLTVTAAGPTVANVQILDSTDTKNVPLGSTTMTFDFAHRLVYWADWPGTAFCGADSVIGPITCGA